ncbi:dTMP kinase [Paenibacillus sp. GXUN7292]|uniref:dTMP kinase n=1 Tax=Paenibacillus sp. GXUN7292 TaxID=3422499 RepID=UPI003D7E0574
MNRGLFITFEGGEGSGKSTLIEALANTLISKGRSVVTTREPGGIPIAEKIREVILDRSHTSMDARTEALLYAAARRQHLVEKVIPAIEAGSIVLCDRFIDSSLAYQGYARGLGMDEVWAINLFAIQERMPDLTLFLDLEPSAGLARIAKAAEREVNRLDLEKLEFHERVRTGYEMLLERHPNRIERINADQTRDKVFSQVLSIIEARLAGIA